MSSQTPPAERSVILQALASIRWRLFAVRLAERIALALAWGSAIAIPLTAARLLRNARYGYDAPWLPLVLAAVPLLAAYWLYRQPKQLKKSLSPLLAKIAALLTVVASVLTITLTFVPMGATVPVWAVPVSVIAIFIVLAAVSVRMIDNRAAAIFVDQQAGLRERVSTALEILNSPNGGAEAPLEAAFNAPVIASALAACGQFRDADVRYSKLGTRTYALAAVAVTAAICLSIVPPIAIQARTIKPPSIVVVKNVKDLQQVFKELEEKKLPNDKITSERLKPLQNAINQIQQGNMSQIEANAALNEAKSQMKRDQEALGAADKVQEMLRQIGQTQEFANSTDELKKAEMMQAQGAANAERNQKTADQGLKDAAQTFADKMNGMSDAEKKSLADSLQAAADKAKGDPQLQKDLQNAADAARKGDSGQMAQSMQSAGERMGQQQANRQMSQESINRAMSEIDRMQNSGPGSTMGSPPDSAGQQAGGQSGGNPDDGQQGGGQQGGGQASSGNNAGSNSAASGGEGSGSGGGNLQGRDSGSTNLEQAGGPGGRQTGPIGGIGSFVRVYDQRINESSGTQEKVGSFINPLGPANGSTDVMGAADKSDPSIKTYAEVLPEARQRAMDELTRQEYPPQYQEMVRQFYSEGGKPK